MARVPRANPVVFSKMASQDKDFMRNLFSDRWKLSRAVALVMIVSIVLLCLGLMLLY